VLGEGGGVVLGDRGRCDVCCVEYRHACNNNAKDSV
jgi:hypothetical protein